MTETGWPLIPREVLPAPIPAAKRRPHPHAAEPAEAGRQLPFFGAETTEPSPADLAGLLAGPGRLGRMGGTARVSVPVDAAWRVHVLVAELVARGLVANWRPLEAPGGDPPAEKKEDKGKSSADSGIAEMPDFDPELDLESDDLPVIGAGSDQEHTMGDGVAPGDDVPEEDAEVADGLRFEVLTAYSRRLNGLARAWPEAAAQLFLSGPRLRLWVAAAGEPVPGGYALGLDPAKDPAEIDAALVRAGLAGRVSPGGRRYLIMGKRRLARLAELVGERPPAAPPDRWPGGARA